MPESIGYVVAVINQASGRVEDTLPSGIIHSGPEDAAWERDVENDRTAEAGRHDRYFICELVPEEGGLDA